MSIEQVRESLGDSDAEVRRRAVLAAQHESSSEVGPLLLLALGDEDWRVRKEAVQICIRRASELMLVDALVDAICQGENVGLRNAALDVLQGIGEHAARALVAALSSVPEHARKFVVEALGDSRGPLVIAELSGAAESSDPNVASEAIEALSRIGGPEAVRAIRKRLAAKEPFLRMVALDALNRCEATLTWDELAPLIPDRLLRRVVVSALGRTGRPEAVAPLFEALEEPVQHVVSAAALAIARLAAHSTETDTAVQQNLGTLSERALSSLRGVLANAPDPEFQRAAAELLAEACDVPSLGAMMTHLASDAPMPRMVAALQRWGSDAVPSLLSLYATLSSPRERAIALELSADLVLGQPDADAVRSQRVLGALREGLFEREPSIQLVAVHCLGQWGEPTDAALLAAQTVVADEDIARAAVRALEELGKRSPDAVEQALSRVSEEGAHGVALATVTAAIGRKGAPDKLQRLMSSDHPDVRRAAVAGLGKVGGARAKSLLAIALVDEDPDVQIVAANALGRLRDELLGGPYVDELLLATDAELPHVRSAVARALGETGSSRAVAPLRDLLRDHDSGVAMAAVEALGKLGPELLARHLEPALMHADAEVVKAALRALSGWRDPSALDALTSALSHPAWDVRQLSAELLGDLGDVRAREPVATQLAREVDDLVRLALSDAFSRLAREG